MFKESFGRNLMKDLKGELSGDLEYALMARAAGTLADQDVFFCYDAMKGAGTNEAALIDVLCTQTNESMKALKAAWNAEKDREDLHSFGNKNLEKRVVSETSGTFKQLLVALLQAARSEDDADEAKCLTDAKSIFDAGVDKWGTDESTFIRIIAKRSPAQLKMIMKFYKKATKGRDMYDDIESEFSGDLRTALLTTIKAQVEPVKFWAARLNKAMKGMGTDEKALIRVLNKRCDIDLKLIQTKYRKEYTKDLDDHVKRELSGKTEKAMLALLKGNED